MKNFIISFGLVLSCLIIAVIISILCGFAAIGLETIFIFGFVLIFGLMPGILIWSAIEFNK